MFVSSIISPKVFQCIREIIPRPLSSYLDKNENIIINWHRCKATTRHATNTKYHTWKGLQ